MATRRSFLQTVGLTLAASPLAKADEAGGESADASTLKRIYIAADDHTDYMWTADEAEYRKSFLKTIDHYLDLADQTDDREAPLQSRWNCDGLLWFYEYQQNRSEEATKRLVKRIKSGHISVPMTILVSCYGGMPTEAAIRGLYYGGHVEREYGIELPVAMAMENQTLPYGLGMLWAGSGVKYSWKGICGCASKLKHSGSNRQHDVYWWVGPDGSRILMKWYSLAPPLRRGIYSNEGPGGYAEARHAELAIRHVETDATFLDKNPQKVIGLFGQGWDDLETIVSLHDPKRSFPAVAKKMTTETRRVIVSNQRDYFEDFEKHYGDGLPEVACSFGNEWELYTASLAEVSASVKRSVEKLRTAEALATLVAKHEPDFADDLEAMKQQAWIAFGLYWEHDWTADGPVSKKDLATWQRKIAGQITDYVDALHELASSKIANMVNVSETPGSLFVFNPLGWQRNAVAEVALETVKAEGAVEVFDVVTKQVLPSQIVYRNETPHLQFAAKDLPPLGYRIVEIRTSAKASDRSVAAQPTIQVAEGTIRWGQQSLTIMENGSFSSWTHEGLEKTLIANDQVGNHLKDAMGSMEVESRGPVSTTVRVQVARPIKRQTRITVYEAFDRIDIENQIQESFADVKKWKFEFSLDSPQTIHEEVGAILHAATLENGGHYADENARTDWLTLNHFATLQDDDAAVMIANRDCLFFHLGEDVTQPMDSNSSTVQVLAGGQIDGKKLGIRNQGGDRQFTQRFSLQAGKVFSRAESMKRSLEFANPVVVIPITQRGKALNGKTDSLLAVDHEDVIVWAVKPAEKGSSSQNRADQNRPEKSREE